MSPAVRLEQERRALVALARLAEPPSEGLVRLVQASGAHTVLTGIASGRLTGAPEGRGVSHQQEVDQLARWRARLSQADVDRDLRLAARVGARFVVPGDPEWPAQVEVLGSKRPLGLWVRGQGSLAEVTRRSVAVVGARASTPYGEHVASDLSASLVQRGWPVVSGAAFGIDAAAHRGALAAGGPTVAVLACGVDLAYPRAHEGLLAGIARAGLLVSEYSPGTPVTRGRFLERNRLLAALSTGTVLVEAGLRSGARSTVKHARSVNRPVLVVPGPVTSPASAGCHEELRGLGEAVLVTDADDVLEVLGPLLEVDTRRRGPDRPLDVLDVDGLSVYDAMPLAGAVAVDELAVSTGLPVGELLARLASMAGQGLVEPVTGGWRRASKP